MRYLALSAVLSFVLAAPAQADPGQCGQPRSGGDRPTIADVLHMLSSVAHGKDCPLDACDVDGDCEVSLEDAVLTIRHILDRDVKLSCDGDCGNDGDGGGGDGDDHRFCGRSEAPTCGGWCPESYTCREVERGERVKICHKPWWEWGRGRTLEVSEHAVPAHLRHGDYVGECESCHGRDCDERDKDWAKEKRKKDKKRTKRDNEREKKHGKKHGDRDFWWRGFGCRCERGSDSTTTTTTIKPTTTTTTIKPSTTTTTMKPSTTTTMAPTTTTTTGPTTTTTLAPPVGDQDNDGMPDQADPCLADPRNACVGTVAMDSTTGNEIRVNANVSGAPCAGTKVDCAGDTWFADFGYSDPEEAFGCIEAGGCPISGVAELFGCTSEASQDLFRCEHWDPAALPELSYSFDVPNGLYVVNTFWANIFSDTAAVGARLVDIIVEGNTVYPAFDQVAAAGGVTQRAVVRSAVVAVADGNGLQIVFGHVKENPGIKAIEVLKVN